MTPEVIIGIISLVIDFVAIVISAKSLSAINKVKNEISNTDKSKLKNELKNTSVKGDFVGRDKNG